MAQKRSGCLVMLTGAVCGSIAGAFLTSVIVSFGSGGNDILGGFIAVIAAPIFLLGGSIWGAFTARQILPFRGRGFWEHGPVRRAALVVIGVPLFAGSLLFSPLNPRNPPADARLLSAFDRNEAELNQIVSMIHHDKGLERVDDSWTQPHDVSRIHLTPARITDYRSLLNKIGIPRGFNVSDDGEIQFFNHITGSAISSDEMKGFAYLSHAPQKMFATLDGRYGDFIAYRHIRGNWYLFYRYLPG